MISSTEVVACCVGQGFASEAATWKTFRFREAECLQKDVLKFAVLRLNASLSASDPPFWMNVLLVSAACMVTDHLCFHLHSVVVR